MFVTYFMNEKRRVKSKKIVLIKEPKNAPEETFVKFVVKFVEKKSLNRKV